jgi:hypothetical protein
MPATATHVPDRHAHPGHDRGQSPDMPETATPPPASGRGDG